MKILIILIKKKYIYICIQKANTVHLNFFRTFLKRKSIKENIQLNGTKEFFLYLKYIKH